MDRFPSTCSFFRRRLAILDRSRNAVHLPIASHHFGGWHSGSGSSNC